MDTIRIKLEREIKVMLEGGKILAFVMQELEKMVKPGIRTIELDQAAEKMILEAGAVPSFKDYLPDDGGMEDPYPSTLCVSVNEIIVHGLPSERKLKEGDIVSLDCGLLYKGYHSDMAITVPVGKVSFEAQRLIKVCKNALKAGIKEMVAGGRLGNIENAIQKYVESQGFNVVRELCGHGIGRSLHEDPQVLNYGERGRGPQLKEGMVLCLEPMVTAGRWQIKKANDRFGWRTIDGSLAAHFEHTIAIDRNGPIILTSVD